MKVGLRTLGVIGALGIMSAATGAAPPAVLDKTVTVSWTTSGTGKRMDGTSVSFSNTNTRVIYIGSAGRPFLRMQVRGHKATREGNFAPDQAHNGSISFQGNKLVGTEGFASGARQVLVTFDASFASCSVSVIDGKSGGAKIKRKGPDGAMYEIDSATTLSPGCSIQSGNAFAH